MRAGTLIAERFQLERAAAAGGMGVVHLARDLHAGGRATAVKTLHPGSVEEARFTREAEVLCQLRHPGIVAYVAHGRAEDGRAYLAMEWLEGESLSERLKRGALSQAEAVRLGVRVAEALDVAHRAGVVHRDIKPSNLFLPGGEIDRVKVLDFGIARVGPRRPRITVTGEILGTPGYMAPEQAHGESTLDARADLFSLGCVLFRCLTGVAPFQADDPLALLLKVVLEEAPRVRSFVPDVPAPLDELVAQLLEKAPAARPADAREVQERLGRLGGFSERAGGPGGVEAAPAASTLTAAERRLMCVVLARPSGAVRDRETLRADEGEGSGATEELPARVEALRAAVGRQGGALSVLANGALLVTRDPLGSAAERQGAVERAAIVGGTDYAALMARCALALAPLLGGAPIVVAAGRGVLMAQGAAGAEAAVPIGVVIERGVELLAREVPGERSAIRLDPVAASLLEGRFDVRVAGDVRTLHGEHDEAGVNREVLGRATPFVGRERELGWLVAMVEACKRERSARAVLVTGPAGIGKSRLRRELIRTLRQRGAPIEVWVARGDPLGARLPRLMPALQVEGAVAILVIEDLHWGCMGLFHLANATLRRMAEQPLLVLGLARPEGNEGLPGIEQWSRFEHLSLGPLPGEAAESLVRSLLGSRGRTPLVASLVERAEGNPFYLEELIRAAAEGSREALPESVLALVQARIRALDAPARLVLRAASVFGRYFRRDGVLALLSGTSGAELGVESERPARGRSFQGGSAPLSEAALDAALASALDAELIDPSGEPGRRGTPRNELTFRSTMLRDAVYDTLVDADARLAHRLAAEWLLSTEGEPDPAVMAQHLALGGELESAIPWYGRATQRAVDRGDWAAVLAHAERAVACGARGEALGQLRTAQAMAHLLRGEWDDSRPRAGEALGLLRRGSPAWCEAASLALMTAAHAGAKETLALLVSQVWDAPVEALPEAGIALVDAMHWLHLTMQRELLEAILARLEGLSEAEMGRHPKLAAAHHAARAKRAVLTGDPLACARSAAMAYRAFLQAGAPHRAVRPAAMRIDSLVALGAHEEAADLASEVLVLAEKTESEFLVACVRHCLSLALAGLGRLDEGLAVEADVLEVFLLQGNRDMIGWSRARLARMHVAAGDLGCAFREATAAAEMLTDMPPLRASALATLAGLWLARGEPRAALAAAAEAMDILHAARGVCDQRAGIPLAYAEALLACGEEQAGREVAISARDQLLARAGRIDEMRYRESFLTRVPENVRTLELAERSSR